MRNRDVRHSRALSQAYLSAMEVAERLAGFEPGTGYTLVMGPNGRARKVWNPNVLAAARRFRAAVSDGKVQYRIVPKRARNAKKWFYWSDVTAWLQGHKRQPARFGVGDL